MFAKAEKGAGVALEQDEVRGRDVLWSLGQHMAVVLKGDKLVLHVASVVQRRSAEPRCPHERIEVPLPHGVGPKDVAKLDTTGEIATLGTRRGDLFYWDGRSGRWWPFGNVLTDGGTR